MPLTHKTPRNSLSRDAHRMPDNTLPLALAHSRRPGTVQRILRAAEQNFAERGLAGARIGAIARAARVNKALLYYYFAGKEELHRFTLETLFQQLRTQISAALELPGTPREQLLRYINVYFDFMMAHPNYPRLFERELMSQEPRLVGLVQQHLRPLHRRLTAVVRAGIAKGEFRRVDPRHTLFTLVAMTVFYFSAAPVLTALWQCNPLAPRHVAARRRAILDFMEHALFLPPARKR
jgi:TetR/AcrR family transcriptional regulator